MKYQILIDSSCDLNPDYLKETNIGLNIIPIKIYVSGKEYIDDENLDVQELITAMNNTKEKMGSACPSPEDWSSKFGNAEYTFVVTMTSNLSGTYNSAVVARDMAENKDKIHIFDSKSTSGSMELIVDEIVRLINEETEFNEIIKQVEEFIKTRNLFFILHKFDNLIANGRMSKFAGLMAKTLVIKPVCTASKEGTIDIVHKCIGSLNAYKKMAELAFARCKNFFKRKLIITHCNNQEDATKIKDILCEKCNFKEIIIKPMRGLTSLYAQEKGVIACF